MTYVISGEYEIQKQKDLLLLSNIHPVLFIVDLITYLFRMVFEDLYPQQILWLLFQQIISLSSSLSQMKKLILEVKVFGNSIAA